jgi:hypothetical protein
MTYLPQLRDQLVALPAEGAPSRRRRATIGAALTAIAAVLTGGALAIAGVLPTGGKDARARRGNGVTIPSSARVLPLRFDDPAGGPPWGMRIWKTTRGAECVQVGRIVDGKLGFLGQDESAGNDGRFHEAPLDVGNCAPLDAGGHAFLSITTAVPASAAFPPACAAARPHLPKPPPGVTPAKDTRPLCAPADNRKVLFGLVGPDVKSLSYRADDGSIKSQPVAAPEGAYVLVFRDASPSSNGYSLGSQPAVGFRIKRIDYRNGTRCDGKVGHLQHPIKCPLAGYTPPEHQLTAAQAKRPLHVHGIRRLVVSFRAPAAVTSVSSSYQLFVMYHHGGRTCSGGQGKTTDRDYAKGAVVRMTVTLPLMCHDIDVDGTVSYSAAGAANGPEPPLASGPRTVTVGEFARRVP